MNILFSNIFYVSPTQGGTERVTFSVGSSLKKLGHTIYSIYSQGIDNGDANDLFHDSRKLRDLTDTATLSSLLKLWQIDAVIVQGAYAQVKWYRKAIQDIPSCKLYFAHHFEPGWELHEFTFVSYWRNLLSANSLRGYCVMIAHILLYPYERRRYIRQLPRWYKEAYDNADKVILLCKGFISQYMKFACVDNPTKFVVIPNMLSFDKIESPDRIKYKKNHAIIVSRMTEPQKRISLALKIWEECMKDPQVAGWKLYIIGEGEDLLKYQQTVKARQLPNVTFLGRQDPIPFYQVASIFIMTSLSEGWGLTLTESMQNAVVPLAFDTYATLHDIITDTKDGYIIPEGDINGYVRKLKHLMLDSEDRNRMAIEGLESAKRFTAKKVGQIWDFLLTNQ